MAGWTCAVRLVCTAVVNELVCPICLPRAALHLQVYFVPHVIVKKDTAVEYEVLGTIPFAGPIQKEMRTKLEIETEVRRLDHKPWPVRP